MKNAGLHKHQEVWDFGQGRDVDPQHLHSELPVAVPHGDGEDPLVVLPVDGELLVGT